MVKPVNQILGSAPLPARPVRDGAPAPAPAQTDTLATTPETISVASGDTLSKLAAKHQVSLEQIRQLNPELFKAGTDARGRVRAADGGKIYEGDQVRLRAAAAPPAVSAAQTAIAGDRVVAAAKQFIDAAGNSADPGVIGEAQSMLGLIPAGDPDRTAYEAKVKALAAKAPVGAPAGEASSDLATLSEAFNDASQAYDKAADPAAKAAARTQALIAYQRVAQAVAVLPASEAKDIAQGQLEMMELRLKGMGTSDAAIGTSRQAAGLAPASAAAPAPAVATPIDPAAQEAFANAQARFDEASESYDNAVKNSTSLSQAAAGIQAAQQKALAAFNEALAAASKVGPSTQPSLDAMAQRLKQLGISDKAIADAKAKAPPMQEGMGAGPTAGGPPAAPGTVLPVGTLPQPGAAAPVPAATPQGVTDQFGLQRQLFLKAIEDYVNASSNGDQAGAENARARAKAAYAAAAKLVGQMDANTKPSYNKLLDDFEDKLQFYRVASIAEMDPVRKEAKLTPSASTAWAPVNQAPGAAVPDVSKIQRNGATPAAAGGPVVTPKSEEPKSDEERKAREQLGQMLPKMGAGQIAKLPYDSVKAASSEQRGFMLKELLDHWWVGGDKKKYAADVIEIASGEGKLDATLRQIDIQMKGGGIKQIFKKLEGADRERTVKNIFWDLKDMNPVAPDVLSKVAGEMKKDDVRAVLKSYGYAQTSDWFKRVPADVKAQWAKTLGGGWFGKSSEDGAMIQALQAAAKG